MSVRGLIDAIHAGDSVAIEQNFEAEMANRIADRIADMRQEVAKSMFSSPVQEDDEVEETETA